MEPMEAAAGVFRWPAAGEWVREARRVLEPLPGPLPALPLDAPPAPPHAGAWVGRLLGAAGEHALSELAGRFAARYHTVEAFHGGRPDDPAAYARHGVRVPTAATLAGWAHERFIGGGVTREAVDRLLAQQESAIAPGCSFSIDRRFSTERETFYLVYGSHFLLGLAVLLERETGVPLRQRLRERGVPTLLTCAVPISAVPRDVVEAICRECIRLALGGWTGETLPPLRLDFRLHADLPADRIVRIEHPQPGYDPFRLPHRPS